MIFAIGIIVFCLCLLGTAEFFEELQLVLELGQPLSDAIHQLEEDIPLLSQVFLVFEKLVRGTRAWAEKVEKVCAEAVTLFCCCCCCCCPIWLLGHQTTKRTAAWKWHRA